MGKNAKQFEPYQMLSWEEVIDLGSSSHTDGELWAAWMSEDQGLYIAMSDTSETITVLPHGLSVEEATRLYEKGKRSLHADLGFDFTTDLEVEEIGVKDFESLPSNLFLFWENSSDKNDVRVWADWFEIMEQIGKLSDQGSFFTLPFDIIFQDGGNCEEGFWSDSARVKWDANESGEAHLWKK